MSINLADLIDGAPDILKFVIPGFCFVLIFTKLTCTKIESIEKWILSVVVSFTSIAFVESIASKLNRTFNTWELSFWCITACALSGVIFSLIWNSNFAKNIFRTKFGATLSDGALNNAIDWDEASYVCVYLNGSDEYYTGYIVMIDEGSSGWLTISSPVLRSADHTIVSSNGDDSNVVMAIPMVDVKRIKIIN